eukprot:766955-Hanusia_phi.AAC.3
MGFEDLEEFEVELAVRQYNEIEDPLSWYECRKENETPLQIAKMFEVEVDALVTVNKEEYPGLLRNSKLKDRTWLMIPPLHSTKRRKKLSSVRPERHQDQSAAETSAGGFGNEENAKECNSVEYKKFSRRTRKMEKNDLHFGKENTPLDQKSDADRCKSSCEDIGTKRSKMKTRRQETESVSMLGKTTVSCDAG